MFKYSASENTPKVSNTTPTTLEKNILSAWGQSWCPHIRSSKVTFKNITLSCQFGITSGPELAAVIPYSVTKSEKNKQTLTALLVHIYLSTFKSRPTEWSVSLKTVFYLMMWGWSAINKISLNNLKHLKIQFLKKFKIL